MATCKNCKDNEQITQQAKDDFAYVCMNRTIGRLIAIVIVCICLLFASNAAWLYYECQFSDIVTTIEAGQDGSGVNIVSGGDLDYGAESEDNNP